MFQNIFQQKGTKWLNVNWKNLTQIISHYLLRNVSAWSHSYHLNWAAQEADEEFCKLLLFGKILSTENNRY